MHWLQSTFATRFNRLRQERGHLFQGRYQALLIEDSAALANVVDYIHLNPVRAGMVTPELLGGFRWSSLRRFTRPERPVWMNCGDWLAQRGLEDSPLDWRSYVSYLTELAGNEAEQKCRGLEGLSAGLAIGTQGWKRAVAKDHAQRALSPGVEAGELRELKSAHWTQVLNEELQRRGKNREDAAGDNCGAAWKIEVAGRLRHAGAPYAWITAELRMGKVSSIRSYLSQVKKHPAA